jgi:hypothetical protein
MIIILLIIYPWITFKCYLLVSGDDKIEVLSRALNKKDKRGKYVSMFWWPIVLNNLNKLKYDN